MKFLSTLTIAAVLAGTTLAFAADWSSSFDESGEYQVAQSSYQDAIINDSDGYTNVRSGPGSKYKIIGRIYEGNMFFALPTGDQWWRVEEGDLKGWMHRSRVELIEYDQN